MRTAPRRAALGLLLLVACVSPAAVHAARIPGLCDAVSTDPSAPALMIFGAFPAELVALVAATAVDATVELDGRRYYRGSLRGVRVILGLTGIGVVNAFDRTASVSAGFELAGIVMSGVAGTTYNIGDVVLPDDWVQDDERGTFHPNDALVALARRANDPLSAPLAKCTLVPPGSPTAETVCMPNDPKVVFGGLGESGDPYDGAAPCTPGSTGILGCELPALAAVAPARNDDPPVIVDMETTAVARAAKAARLPFLGIRAGSDGNGDPKGFRPFPAQFFDYHVLAADNAAAVTIATVAELAEAAQDPRLCKQLAKRRWRGAAKRIARAAG